MSFHYRGHGLAITSDTELPLSPAPPWSSPDFVLRCGGDTAVPAQRPDGELLATVDRGDGGVFYVLVRQDSRTILRYPGVCDFVGDRGFTRVTAHWDPEAERGLLPVLAAGALLAVHLTLQGHLVLHASAIRLDGRALAFVGASGMGKSTLAAALCTAGCELVADDVLRVDVQSGAASPPRAYPGSIETRLRTSARELADTAPPDAVRATADGRLSLRPTAVAAEPVPLLACVVPRPSRAAVDVEVHRLGPARALLRLSQFPRVLGWRDPATMDRAFQALADLVERVPVAEVTIPWGPPFRPEVLSALLAALLHPADPTPSRPSTPPAPSRP